MEVLDSGSLKRKEMNGDGTGDMSEMSMSNGGV